LAALAWSMGLSMGGVGICGEWASAGSGHLRGVGIIFSFFGEGLRVGRMSVWRAVQEKGEELRRRAKATQGKHKVRVLGVDGAWIRLNGETTGVPEYRSNGSSRHGQRADGFYGSDR